MSKTSGGNLSYIPYEPNFILSGPITKEKVNLCYKFGIQNEA
jgi:hypothetical protein